MFNQVSSSIYMAINGSGHCWSVRRQNSCWNSPEWKNYIATGAVPKDGGFGPSDCHQLFGLTCEDAARL